MHGYIVVALKHEEHTHCFLVMSSITGRRWPLSEKANDMFHVRRLVLYPQLLAMCNLHMHRAADASGLFPTSLPFLPYQYNSLGYHRCA